MPQESTFQKKILEISPRSSVFNLHLSDVWNYRDLLWLLVRRDFVSFYKQTILGPFWFFLQPIITTVIFAFVFGGLAHIDTGGVPGKLFYLSGTVAWNYFFDCVTKTSTVFKDNANIFGKVYFPRLIMPLSIIFSNLVKFAVQLGLLIVVLLYYVFTHQAHPNWYILLFPVVVLLMALLGLGIGLIVTALTTKYRDLAFLVTFGMQLLMYGSAVVYSLSSRQALKYRTIIAANPISGLIETFRYGLTNAGNFYPGIFAYSAGVSVLLFLIGLIVFNKVEKNFVDTV